MTPLAEAVWGAFPYLCLVTMVVGTIHRYQTDQLGWGSRSSELLEKKQLVLGSALFHWGLLFVIGGHFLGLIVPLNVYHAIRVPDELYHAIAIIVGGAAGIVTFLGISILLYRRIANKRVRANSTLSDYVSDGLLWAIIGLGLVLTLGYSAYNVPYTYRATIGPWVRSVLSLQPNVQLMVDVPVLFQIHTVLGLILFAIFPYTRLVHILSAPIQYLVRAPLQYRARFGFAPQAPATLAARPDRAQKGTPNPTAQTQLNVPERGTDREEVSHGPPDPLAPSGRTRP